MISESIISNTVMRRVRAIYVMRMLAPIASGCAVFAICLWGIGREVWVAKVVENVRAVAHNGDAIRYIAGAFIHTDLLVQILSVLAITAFAWITMGVIRNIQTLTKFA